MKRRLRDMTAGAVVAVLLCQLLPGAAALLTGKTIQVSTGVSIYLDDQKLNPKDAKGNSVEAFLYNGTTYLPVRAIGEALGKAVVWDSANSRVYLGRHKADPLDAKVSQRDTWCAESTKARDRCTTTVSFGYEALPAGGDYLLGYGAAATVFVQGGSISQISEHNEFASWMESEWDGTPSYRWSFFFREGVLYLAQGENAPYGGTVTAYYENGVLLCWTDETGTRHSGSAGEPEGWGRSPDLATHAAESCQRVQEQLASES